MFFCLTLLKPNSRLPTKTNKISCLIFSLHLRQPPIRLPNYTQLPYHVQYCSISSPSLSLSRNQLLYMSFFFLSVIFFLSRFLSPFPQVLWGTKLTYRLSGSFNIIEIHQLFPGTLFQYTTLLVCYHPLFPHDKDCFLHHLSSLWSVHWGLKVIVQLWFMDGIVI